MSRLAAVIDGTVLAGCLLYLLGTIVHDALRP